MDNQLEKKPLGSRILKLPVNMVIESHTADAQLGNSNPSNKEPTSVVPPLPILEPISEPRTETILKPEPESEPQPDFNSIYRILHGKFSAIINMKKPVLLAVGIRKEMSKETGVSSVVLKKWIAWYCRKSNYYANHIQGAIRFHLDGNEAGIVTENHQEKMEKRLKKTKSLKTTPTSSPLQEQSTDSDCTLSDPIINDIK